MNWRTRRRLATGVRLLGHVPQQAGKGRTAWFRCRDCTWAWGDSVTAGNLVATLRRTDVCRGGSGVPR